MEYITIWNTTRKNRVLLARNVLEENGIQYRLLGRVTGENPHVGHRIQVREDQRERAEAVLREHGLLRDPNPGAKRIKMSRFWIWLGAAILLVVIASIIINKLMMD